MHIELLKLARRKDMTGVQDSNRAHRTTRNGAWLSSVPHCLNGTELSQEEFQDNLCLRYGLMPQNILAACDGCGKKFSIEHALPCPNSGLVLARHDNAAMEWGALGAWALIPSDITYEPKINIRTVQGERTGARARQEGGLADAGTGTVGESQVG